MRFILLILAVAIITNVNATTYYFSNSDGNDSYSSLQAQNAATPWKTLKKLNTIMGSLEAGDSVLFKRGDEFYGSIDVTQSGTAKKPIVFSAYGSGNKPAITGLTALTNWTNTGNNIWKTNFLAEPFLSVLTINNNVQPIGRYPNATAANKGYLTIESHVSNTQITSSAIAGNINWSGAQIVIRKNRGILDRNFIKGQSVGTISYKSATSYSPMDGYGFFIQNDIRTLDQFGEWYYDTTAQVLYVYFGQNNPSGYTVKAAGVNTLVDISNTQNISFSNLQFIGSNQSSFKVNGAQKCTISSCVISISGENAIDGKSTRKLTVRSTTINEVYNNAFNLTYDCRNTIIKNNHIKNIGIYPGMGEDDNSYQGISIQGNNSTIEGNSFNNIGYIPITFFKDSIIVKNNFINHFALVKDDGGGIYTWRGESDPVFKGRKILNNIIINGMGAGAGTADTNYLAAEGIYMDDHSTGVEITSNSIADCANSGIYIHNSQNITIRNNICFNNAIALWIQHDGIAPDFPVRNIEIKNNVLYPQSVSQLQFNYVSILNDIDSIGKMDSNYYSYPADNSQQIRMQYDKTKPSYIQRFDLDQWKSSAKKDIHSKYTPRTLPLYVINSLIGSNKFSNGNFDANISGLYAWNSLNTSIVSWDGKNKLNGGSLKLSYSSISTQNITTSIIMGTGSISNSKKYILTFSILGTKKNGSIGVFLRKSANPYTNLTDIKYLPLNNTRSDYEILFSKPGADSDASIVFLLKDEDSTVYIDNIQLHQADITMNKISDLVKFYYNNNNTSKNLDLIDNYVNVDSIAVNDPLSLPPYSSEVLTKTTSQSSSLNSFNFSAQKEGTINNLQWQHSSVDAVNYYDIERSEDGYAFEPIGKIKTTKGFFDYIFNDEKPISGKNFYRIRQQRFDGSLFYSKVILIDNNPSPDFQVLSNPAKEELKLKISGCEKGNLMIRSINGSTIKTLQFSNSNSLFTFDVSSLESGIYIVSLISQSNITSKKFVKID